MWMTLLIEIVTILLSYLVGSLSSAVIVCKLTGAPDPRSTGSKNPGATNVLRIGGKWRAVAVLVGDVLKGVLAVYAAFLFFPTWVVACCWLAVFLGHLWPIFFGFKGGKGVATAFGGLLGLHWPVALSILGIWLAVVVITRYSSLGALVAAIACPLVVWGWLDATYASTAFLIATILLYRHKENIVRLLQGKETKVGQKAAPQSAPASDSNSKIDKDDVIQ